MCVHVCIIYFLFFFLLQWQCICVCVTNAVHPCYLIIHYLKKNNNKKNYNNNNNNNINNNENENNNSNNNLALSYTFIPIVIETTAPIGSKASFSLQEFNWSSLFSHHW